MVLSPMARVLIPIPSVDFDPSEVAIPWHVLGAAGHDVAFATPDGAAGRADDLMLTGRGLDPWGFVPGLDRARVLGLVLRAGRDARAAYARLERDAAFLEPLAYGSLRVGDHDALVLPGGHRARGMRAYLESVVLQDFVGAFFDAGKPVGAICHGVVLAARSTSRETGRSVLFGRKTTGLTWSLERRGWRVGRVGRFWDPDYYRTYVEQAGEPAGYRSVESEVKRALARPGDFLDVPPSDPDAARKESGRHRDAPGDARPAFVVRDGSYVSGRWPGDANTFAQTFAQVIAMASPRRASRTA
jgi:putative intracellular protease/amidase